MWSTGGSSGEGGASPDAWACLGPAWPRPLCLLPRYLCFFKRERDRNTEMGRKNGHFRLVHSPHAHSDRGVGINPGPHEGSAFARSWDQEWSRVPSSGALTWDPGLLGSTVTASLDACRGCLVCSVLFTRQTEIVSAFVYSPKRVLQAGRPLGSSLVPSQAPPVHHAAGSKSSVKVSGEGTGGPARV